MTGEPEVESSSRRKLGRMKSGELLKRSGSSRSLIEPSGSSSVRRSSRHLLAEKGSSSFDGHDRDRRRGEEDYDDAIAKVAARFGSGNTRSSGKERRSSRKLQRAETEEPVSEQPVSSAGHRSKKPSVPEHYEDALAKVAARFGADKQVNSPQQQSSFRSSSHKKVAEVCSPSSSSPRVNAAEDYEKGLDQVAENAGKQQQRPAVRRGSSRRLAAENYEDALAKVAARFSAETTRSSAKEKRNRDKLPDNYEDALAKVAARFGSGRSNSSRQLVTAATDVAVVYPKRRGSHKSLTVDANENQAAHAENKPRRRSSHKSLPDNVEDKPKRRTSSRLRDDETEIVENVKREVERRLSESSNHSEGGRNKEKDSATKARPAPPSRGLSRQYSDDSADFDGAIVEAMNEEEMNQQKASGGTIDEPKRKVERRGSDSSLDPNKPGTIGGAGRGRERSRGLRRTTSEELHVLEFADRAEADVRVRTDGSPKRKPKRKKKTGLKVTFIEDLKEKNGIKSTYLENEEPLTAEEKAAAWYGGRNYKLFKSLCYTESVEAKENEDYCSRFDKVWAACATTSVDFAWQEIMKAEHKKSSPNNAVMLAKARCRGFEREIFPDTLLRNRLATVKYVVRSYKQALLSMTISKQDQERAVREASQRCSQPFRRFARLMAEGDALLVAAWQRVAKKDDSLDDSGHAQADRRASRRDLMAAAGRQSVRNLLASGESRRDLFSSLKSSGSCRKLISPSDYTEESRRNLMASSKGDRRNVMSKVESHRDLLMSLKSSGSSRKLMMGDTGSRSKDRVGRQESKRNLMKTESRRDLLSGSRSSESRRNLLLAAGARAESKRNLGSKSGSSRRLMSDQRSDDRSGGDDKKCEEDGSPARPTRRGSSKRMQDE